MKYICLYLAKYAHI